MRATVKTYTIPMDMLMDILKIVMKNDLPNRIEGISVKENFLRLSVKFSPDRPFANEAKGNIESLLSDFGFYANGSPQDLDFDLRGSHDEDDFYRLT